MAATTGLERVARKLIEKGAALNAVDEQYETPLIKAVARGFEPSTFQSAAGAVQRKSMRPRRKRTRNDKKNEGKSNRRRDKRRNTRENRKEKVERTFQN